MSFNVRILKTKEMKVENKSKGTLRDTYQNWHVSHVFVILDISPFKSRSKQTSPCEQNPSKTYQRARSRGSAENVSSLLSHRRPSFWASHSGQTE